MDIEAIADFIIQYSPRKEEKKQYTEKDRERIKDHVVKHIGFKTFVLLQDLEGIILVGRWNIHGKTAFILDFIVHPKCRNKVSLIRYATLLGWKNFPHVEFICFEREYKYPDRPLRVYSIKKIIGVKNAKNI